MTQGRQLLLQQSHCASLPCSAQASPSQSHQALPSCTQQRRCSQLRHCSVPSVHLGGCETASNACTPQSPVGRSALLQAAAASTWLFQAAHPEPIPKVSSQIPQQQLGFDVTSRRPCRSLPWHQHPLPLPVLWDRAGGGAHALDLCAQNKAMKKGRGKSCQCEAKTNLFRSRTLSIVAAGPRAALHPGKQIATLIDCSRTWPTS